MNLKLLIPLLILIIISVAIIFIFYKRESACPFLKPHFPPSDADYYQADSVTGHFHKPNAYRKFEWLEHPSGYIEMKTNNIGLRNETDTKITKDRSKYRVLITGDSHIDGVVNNNESVAYHLENGLNNQHKADIYEVMNAGNGYFGPQNYFAVYQKFRKYDPDIFVVVLYTGNDFLDAIRIESENNRLEVPDRPDDYFTKLWEIDSRYTGFTGQYMNQLKFFDVFPGYADTALYIMQQNILKIKQLCDKEKSSFLVVLLPAKIETEPHTDKIRINEVLQILNFNSSQIEKNRQMVEKLIDWLEKNHINCIDLYDRFNDSAEELFWKADYHINHLGHEKIAHTILGSGFIKK